MSEFSKKWLPRFAWFVLIVVLIQAIRNDRRLMEPIADAIVYAVGWFNTGSAVKEEMEERVKGKIKEKTKPKGQKQWPRETGNLPDSS